MCGPATVSIKCYLPVSQIYMYVYLRGWYIVCMAMYFGKYGVLTRTIKYRRGKAEIIVSF